MTFICACLWCALKVVAVLIGIGTLLFALACAAAIWTKGL